MVRSGLRLGDRVQVRRREVDACAAEDTDGAEGVVIAFPWEGVVEVAFTPPVPFVHGLHISTVFLPSQLEARE